MDAQQSNSRRVRILQRACVATLAILIAARSVAGHMDPWLLSQRRRHVTVP